MKKYELTDETQIFCGRTLYRIKAVIDFSNVTHGDLGGWIEKEENLSQDGNAWVSDDAKVFDSARIYGDAWIYNGAKVYGNAIVYGDARIHGIADVFDDVVISGNAEVRDNAGVHGKARIYGKVGVFDDAEVCGEAELFGDAIIGGDARICGGKWWFSPLYIQGSRYSFNVASDTIVRIGCQNHTWKGWHDKYLSIAKRHDAEDVLIEYVQYFNLACRLYGHEDCLIKEG